DRGTNFLTAGKPHGLSALPLDTGLQSSPAGAIITHDGPQIGPHDFGLAHTPRTPRHRCHPATNSDNRFPDRPSGGGARGFGPRGTSSRFSSPSELCPSSAWRSTPPAG